MGGGQGEVYHAKTDNGERKVVKIYNNEFLNLSSDRKATSDDIEGFISNLKELCSTPSPDPSFVWPIDYFDNDGCYGYVMDYIDKMEYSSLVKYEAEPVSTKLLVEIAISIARSFENLHRSGAYYCDINRNDIFVKVYDGHISLKICDCDNVHVSDYKPVVKGTEGFIAPEIVVNKGHHSIETDLYSIAVLFFRLFVGLWPYKGKLFNKMCNDKDEGKHFWENPVFIFDRTDSRNTLDKSSDLERKDKYWDPLPTYIKNLFYDVFEDGLLDGDERPTATQWINALMSFLDANNCTGTRKACDKRELNFFLLIDTSGSMNGLRIKRVNKILNSMGEYIKEALPPDVDPFLSILSFDNESRWLYIKMNPNEMPLVQLNANQNGDTMMDEAFETLYHSIGSFHGTLMGHNQVSPVIMLFSDGEPSRRINWIMQQLRSIPSFYKAIRIAFRIDEKCKRETLLEFTGDERDICDVYDLDDKFRELIKRITIVSSQITSTLQPVPINNDGRSGWAHENGTWDSNQEKVALSISTLGREVHSDPNYDPNPLPSSPVYITSWR